MTYEYLTQYSSPNFTPAAKVPAAFGVPRKVTAITIHHWGKRGQRFQNVVNFLCRKDGETSAHYVAEVGRVACIVDPDDAAWHAGNGKGNATSIGIECRPEATDGDYETVAELIRNLRATYGDVPLIPHKAWKSTSCPGAWDLARLDRLARQEAPAAAPVVKPVAKPVTPPPVKELELPSYLPLLIDGEFGTRSVVELQRALHRAAFYIGGLVDGGFGPRCREEYQAFLKHKGWYAGLVDSAFGAMSVRAEQRWLKSLGLYRGVTDGQRGPLTIKALQQALNAGAAFTR